MKKTNIIKSNPELSSPHKTESFLGGLLILLYTPYELIYFIGSNDYLYIDDSQVNFIMVHILVSQVQMSISEYPYISWELQPYT